jgi:hypothetical protein
MKKGLPLETCSFGSTQEYPAGLSRLCLKGKRGPMYNFLGFNHEPEESIQLRILKDPRLRGHVQLQ